MTDEKQSLAQRCAQLYVEAYEDYLEVGGISPSVRDACDHVTTTIGVHRLDDDAVDAVDSVAQYGAREELLRAGDRRVRRRHHAARPAQRRGPPVRRRPVERVARRDAHALRRGGDPVHHLRGCEASTMSTILNPPRKQGTTGGVALGPLELLWDPRWRDSDLKHWMKR